MIFKVLANLSLLSNKGVSIDIESMESTSADGSKTTKYSRKYWRDEKGSTGTAWKSTSW